MIIAIDPGKSGGIAVIYGNGRIESEKMPDTERDVMQYLKEMKDLAEAEGESCTCFLEKVSGFIGKAQPGGAMFTFGEGYGFLKGVLMTLKIRLENPTPQVWQKALSLGTSKGLTKTQWKNKLKAKAQELYPSQKVTLSTADALLILEYARRQERSQF